MSTAAVGIWPDSAFPKRIIDDSTVRGGLRAVELGEEDDALFVFFGHPYFRDVLAAIDYIAGPEGYGWDAEDMPEPSELLYTHARLDEQCHGHTGVPAACDCDWSLEWAITDADRAASRGKPGYFPVVIWRVDP